MGAIFLFNPVFNQNLNENCQNRWILICFSSKSIGVIAPISPCFIVCFNHLLLSITTDPENRTRLNEKLLDNDTRSVQKTNIEKLEKISHFKLKCYKCSYCGSTFTAKSKLLRHIDRIHLKLRYEQ